MGGCRSCRGKLLPCESECDACLPLGFWFVPTIGSLKKQKIRMELSQLRISCGGLQALSHSASAGHSCFRSLPTGACLCRGSSRDVVSHLGGREKKKSSSFFALNPLSMESPLFRAVVRSSARLVSTSQPAPRSPLPHRSSRSSPDLSPDAVRQDQRCTDSGD